MTAWLAVFAPLLVAYATTVVWCVERWNSPSQYFAHCWLLPVVAAVVVWLRRREWGALPRAADARGFWLLAPALVLHLAGASLMVDSWSAASLVLAVPGAAWLALGRPRLRGLWPVLWLVLFVVPMPIFVEGRLAFVLKEFAMHGGAWVANLLGADVQRAADRLQPRGVEGSLWIADACGGLRSLLSMLTLAYCLAFFTGAPSFARRLVLLLVAPALAIGANTTRIAVLCLLARHFGVPFAEGTGHGIANVAEWLTVVVALLLVDRCLPVATPTPPVAARAANGPATGLFVPGLLLWLAAVPLCALSLSRPAGESKDRAESLPTAVAGYTVVERSAEDDAAFRKSLPRWRELLGTEDFVWRRYRDAAGTWVNLVALFHDTNWKSVHPPRICIEGSDMDIEVDDLQPAAFLAADAAVGRIVARARADGVRYVTLSVFGTRDWLSGDYWEFTWHHLPRALLRQNMSGFLLRVESAVRSGETTAVAEARCRQFLQALVPAAREALR